MKGMVSFSSEVLDSLDQIFESGARGTHLLFSNDMIREAFDRYPSADLLSDQELAEQVQNALTELMDVDSLDERQEYIESLETETRDILVHLYFGFLDRYLVNEEQSPEILH
jgi:hypothetical protein